jgi:hypothetical protein
MARQGKMANYMKKNDKGSGRGKGALKERF